MSPFRHSSDETILAVRQQRYGIFKGDWGQVLLVAKLLPAIFLPIEIAASLANQGLTRVKLAHNLLLTAYWEAALTAREASQRKQAGKWQDLTPATGEERRLRRANGRARLLGAGGLHPSGGGPVDGRARHQRAVVEQRGGHAQDLKQGVGRGGHGRSVARQARWRSVAQGGQGGIQA